MAARAHVRTARSARTIKGRRCTGQHGTAWRAKERHGMAWQGPAWRGRAQHGMAGTTRQGTAWHGHANGKGRPGPARPDSARNGAARNGTARHGTARHVTLTTSATPWKPGRAFGSDNRAHLWARARGPILRPPRHSPFSAHGATFDTPVHPRKTDVRGTRLSHERNQSLSR